MFWWMEIFHEVIRIFLFSDTVLTIWRPSDDVMELLSEGKRFRIYHLSAGESRLLPVCLNYDFFFFLLNSY